MSGMILVTGGTGMVGRSLKDMLPHGMYISSSDYDLTCEEDVRQLFTATRPECVVHLAAKVGGIIDNISKPAEYFTENILMNTLVLKYSHRFNVNRFIGILSTCIYPDNVDTYPLTEPMLHLGPPAPTNFSYGYAKRCLAVQIDAYNQQYGTRYQYLTPCNLYGVYDKFGENSHFVAALVKKIVAAEQSKSNTLQLFGTGTPLRQFMYSSDLAWVIKQCIERGIHDSFNVATEENLPIKEMAEISLDTCKLSNIDIEFDANKPDGQYRKDVSIEKLKQLLPDFKATTLREGVKRVYDKISK